MEYTLLGLGLGTLHQCMSTKPYPFSERIKTKREFLDERLNFQVRKLYRKCQK